MKRLPVARPSRDAEDTLVFDALTGELALRRGSTPTDPAPASRDDRDPDAVPATHLARQGFFARSRPDGVAIVHPDASIRAPGSRPTTWTSSTTPRPSRRSWRAATSWSPPPTASPVAGCCTGPVAGPRSR